MRRSFNCGALFLAVVVSMIFMVADIACAEGLLNRNSGQPSSLQKQELDDAYYRGYNDAKSGKSPVDYSADGAQNNGDVIRGAGRGALGGAAIGSLSDGDAGRGAAWGAGAGAAKAIIKKKRAAEQEKTWALELSNAYNSGYSKGMAEIAAASAKNAAGK